ncbi:TPA: tetratricopeptide repeat protein, partial [Candidatus Micrarchaeota archaeon]|nr:tetratricopeptide repeat protein [Candidatus Micrarchaeota archaeon]
PSNQTPRQIRPAPRLRLAWANHLLRRQRYDDALEIFSALLEEAPRELLPWVHYNLGNLYLRQAQRQVEQTAFDEAIPLVALAKQSYRQALRLQPDLWAARYNLEAAIRLLPEIKPFPLKSKESGEAAPKALWTRVPGFPRGLP